MPQSGARMICSALTYGSARLNRATIRRERLDHRILEIETPEHDLLAVELGQDRAVQPGLRRLDRDLLQPGTRPARAGRSSRTVAGG